MLKKQTFNHTFLALISSALLTNSLLQAQETPLYSNIPDNFDGRFILVSGAKDNITASLRNGRTDDRLAQAFKTGSSGTVAFRVPMAKLGSPRGKFVWEVWDDNNGRPGQRVAIVGEVALATLAAAPNGELLEFNAPVTDLDPNATYYLVSNNSDFTSIDFNNTFRVLVTSANEGTGSVSKLFASNHGGPWFTVADNLPGSAASYLQMEAYEPALVEEDVSYDLFVTMTEDGAVTVSPQMEKYPAGTEITVTAQPEEGFEFVKWTYGDEEFATNPAIITIESDSTLVPTFVQVVSSDLVAASTEDGTVTLAPVLPNYRIGTEVSVTAEPEEGFEFVKWTYGDEEFTSNPASITVKAGATLTPVFAKKAAELISIDIAPAMAISWDSQSGKTYEIQSSTDLENWVVEAESIEGTGETSTYFFIRTVSEIYYRVAETQ